MSYAVQVASTAQNSGNHSCNRRFMGHGKNKVYNSILDCIGNTPMIKLKRIPKDHGVACDIYAKCEFLNPGGSIKDRVALSMISDAQHSGAMSADTVIVEPTSGNTGIGLAFNTALMTNKCIIVTEDKNSDEKVNTCPLLGAEVIQVKSEKEEFAIANRIRDEHPNTIMLNQFENYVNPRTHYECTGQEIVSALNEIDMVVMTAGTGGTLTGVAARIKENNPSCIVVATESDGSIIFKTGKPRRFLVEGIGYDWIPLVLDKSVVDQVEEVTDEESFLMARELSRKEGLLCGGSSGTAMMGAIKAAKRLNLAAGKRVVVILPDGIRNYMTKFVSDQWMEAHLFMDPPHHTMKWWNHPITNLKLKHAYPIIQSDYTCEMALDLMKDNVAIVVDNHGWFVGVVSKDGFRKYATNPIKLPGETTEDFKFDDPVTHHLVKHVFTLAKNGKKGMPTIGRLSRVLDLTPFVVIGIEGKDNEDNDYFIPEGIATGTDVLDYIRTNSRS